MGQSTEVEFTPGPVARIKWLAFDPNGLWFDAVLEVSDDRSVVVRKASDNLVADKLLAILGAATRINGNFLRASGNYSITNRLEFNREWGWGSSSTLIANLARWADIDPFELNGRTARGSGYDIACAGADKPLFFFVEKGLPRINTVDFHPGFYEHFAFIYLGRKQDTPAEIHRFFNEINPADEAIREISGISTQITRTSSLKDFNQLIDRHERLISDLLGRPTVKEILFPDFKGSVKSLGAWGGDFILASSDMSYTDIVSYFKVKNYTLAFSWNEIIR